MSKHVLQQRTLETSGVSYEQSLVATTHLEPRLFDRIGGAPGFWQLSSLFYERIFQDTAPEGRWFLNIFSSSTKQEAIDNQYRFFVQTFGGPDLYRQKKGKYTRLVGRHANYRIGIRAAERWVQHMTAAIQEHPLLQHDDSAQQALIHYFRYTAFYIVAASDYVRPDQLSGGTQIDADRVW